MKGMDNNAEIKMLDHTFMFAGSGRNLRTNVSFAAALYHNDISYRRQTHSPNFPTTNQDVCILVIRSLVHRMAQPQFFFQPHRLPGLAIIADSFTIS